MNENNKDGARCLGCQRIYGHMDGCPVQAKHDALDARIRLDDMQQIGAELIVLERQRQIEVEGWTPEHDDKHSANELAFAAMCYIDEATAGMPILPRDIWPWNEEWLKHTNPIRDLVKAGALIAAEIDRIQRKANKTESKPSMAPAGAKEAVLKEEPSAYAYENNDAQRSVGLNVCIKHHHWMGLSAWKPTEDEAWLDAYQRIQERGKK